MKTRFVFFIMLGLLSLITVQKLKSKKTSTTNKMCLFAKNDV